jgi:hypothetical protein
LDGTTLDGPADWAADATGWLVDAGVVLVVSGLEFVVAGTAGACLFLPPFLPREWVPLPVAGAVPLPWLAPPGAVDAVVVGPVGP